MSLRSYKRRASQRIGMEVRLRKAWSAMGGLDASMNALLDCLHDLRTHIRMFGSNEP